MVQLEAWCHSTQSDLEKKIFLTFIINGELYICIFPNLFDIIFKRKSPTLDAHITLVYVLEQKQHFISFLYNFPNIDILALTGSQA